MQEEYDVVANAILDDVEKVVRGDVPTCPFAVFDYDNTLVENDLQQAFIAYVCRHQLIRNTTLLHDTNLFFTDNKAYHDVFFKHYYGLLAQGVTKESFIFLARALAGFRIDEIENLVEAIFKEQGNILGSEEYLGVTITKGFRLREKVHDMINECKKRGIAPYVISASPEVLVRAGLKHLGVEVSGCVAVTLEVQDGVLLDSVVEPIPAEEGKISCIQKYIHTDPPVLGFGDTMNDFNMLTYTKVKVVIDRANELTAIAKDNGWYIIKA